MYKGRNPISTAQYIYDNIEESTRFVCRIVGHDPATIWGLPCLTFFRDLQRAIKDQKRTVKNLEKWQTKR